MSGALAAFVLTNPRSRSWAVYASDRELDRWLSSQPTGVVVGVVLAVIALAGLQRSGSRRTAAVLAALCVALLAVAHSVVSGVDTIDTLIALHFAKTATAGFLLGASVALAWGCRTRQVALVLGVAVAYVLAGVAPPARGDTDYLQPASRSTSAIGEPSWILLGAAFALSVAAAVAATKSIRTQRLEQSTILVALGGSLALALTNRVLGAWIVNQEFGSQSRIASVVTVSLAVIVAVTVIVARLFPGTDGVFVLAATAIAAGAITVINDLRDPIVTVHPWVSLAVGVAAVALGMLLPARAHLSGRRQTVLGIAIVAIVPLVAAIAPEFGNDGPFLLVRLAVLGVGVGLAVGGCIPHWAPTAVLGLTLPFGSLVFAAATTIPLSRVVTISNSFEVTAPSSVTPARLTGAAMFLTVLVCGFVVARLRPRPVTDTSAGPHPEDSADTPRPETP